MLKKAYQDIGTELLSEVAEDAQMTDAVRDELEGLINSLREDLIDVQRANGDDTDPDTGEEYDWDNLMVDIRVKIPAEWEDNA